MLTTPELLDESAQCSHLGEVLPRWLGRVPLYRRAGYALPHEPHSPPCAAFRRLPFITKTDIRRQFPDNFLPEGTDLDALLDQDLVELEHTSGTSEDRIPLLLARGWWAEQEERALRRNSLVAAVLDEFPNARRITISSPVCNGDICYSSTPARFDRILGNALHLSLSRQPFLWGDTDLARMAAEAVEWQPQFLDVDPVYGVRFAQYCERNDVRLPSLKFIICSYEFVSVVHRRLLEGVFGVPVFNLYGATETGHLLMENEHGEMLPSLETAFLELVEPDAQGIGRLVVTTLTNDYMPLVRYRIGDLAAQHVQPYRTTYTLHGREGDAFHTPAGGRVTIWQIDQCFKGIGGIAHYQLVQPGASEFALRYVPDAKPPTAEELGELRRRLGDALGISDGLEFQPVDFLLPENSGKFRLGYPLRVSAPARS
jgi:phenylacetate-coenzyme A ligase PaaK-like adenylate-forming protein